MASEDEFYADIRSADGTYKFLVDGAWRESSSGRTCGSVAPADANAPAYAFQACTQGEVDEAFAAARAAHRQWARTPLHERAALLHEVAAEMRAHHAPMAACLVREIAKPAKDAKTEVIRSADLIDYAAEEGVRALGVGTLLHADSFPGAKRDKMCMVSKVPLGVVLCIPPFNYPVNLAVSKIAPALIAGNAVVIKPPTQGTVAGLHMAECFRRALVTRGAPAGLVNVVTGKGSEIGDYLTSHPGANLISFTGGDTGLSVAKKANMVPIQMELGGKDACLVFPDADVNLAASAVAKGGFSYSGQRCTAVKLVLAFENIADVLVESVSKKIEALRVGRPEENADITALVSKASADFVQGLVEDAVKKGAVLKQPWRREDNLVWPCLVDHVTQRDAFGVGGTLRTGRARCSSEKRRRSFTVRQREQVRFAGVRVHEKRGRRDSRRRLDGNRDGPDQRPAGARAGPLPVPGRARFRDRVAGHHQQHRHHDQGEERRDQPRQALVRARVTRDDWDVDERTNASGEDREILQPRRRG
jgi:glyceraldehyde-3-phosphate dehydrogenase (NADP+)